MNRSVAILPALIVLAISVLTPADAALAGGRAAPVEKADQALSEVEKARQVIDRAKSLAPARTDAGGGAAPAAGSTTPPRAAPSSASPSPSPPSGPTTSGAAPATPATPSTVYARIDQIVAPPDDWPAIKLYVSVFDLQNRPIKGLQAADFVVDELGASGKPVDVKTFAESQEGMATLLVLDASGSMRGQPFRDAKRGIDSFLSVLGPTDQAALILLHDQVQLPVSFTAKIEDVKAKLDQADPTAKVTLLYDGIAKAVDEVGARATSLPVRKVIIVMSDGRDEGSTKKLEDVRDLALAANVPIYGVGFTRIGTQYLPNLRRLSDLTGGLYLDARNSSQLSETYARIFEHLKSLYVLKYRPTAIQADGQRHTLAVRVTAQGAQADAPRRSFDAPLRKIAVPVVSPAASGARWRPWAIGVGGLVLLAAVVATVLVWRRRPGPGPVVVPPAAPSATFGRLIVRKGPGEGLEYPLAAATNMIGTAKENQVVVSGAGVAGQHAGIAVSGKKYELTDFGSETGTYVNGVRVTQRYLRDRDVVKIGDIELVFEMARR